MKIVHVVATLDPIAGGLALVAPRLAAAQVRLGHAVHVVAYADPAAAARTALSLAAVPQLEQLRIHLLPKPGASERLLASGASSVLGRLVAGSDWVHLHGVWESLLRVAAETAHRLGVPYCFGPAGMLDPWSLGQKRWKKRLALMLVYRRLIRRGAFVHVLNDAEERLLAPLGLSTPNEMLPNGVFLEEIEPLPRAGSFRERLPKLKGRSFVLFLGRLHAKKGLDQLADAFAMLAAKRPELDLVVAGPDGGAQRPFERQIRRLGLVARVHLVGLLSGRDKFAALVDAECFCLPSRQEGFSLAITEALACGVPVVISEACHFPEVAEVGAGRVVRLEAGELASALDEVLGDARVREQMGAAGRALVRARYTWPEIAGRALAAYQRARRGPR